MNIIAKVNFRIKRSVQRFRLRSQVLDRKSLVRYYLSGFSADDLLQVTVKGFRKPIFVRKNNEIDLAVIKYVFFQQFHLPPSGYKMPKRPVIVDLGSNIGLTIKHLKKIYPESRVLGVEMDVDNYALALKNCQGLRNVSILNNAVWFEASEVIYDKSKKTDAYRIDRNGHTHGKSGSVVSIKTITIDHLISQHGVEEIDFLKMDIEGAEAEIFKSGNLAWLDKVRSMNIEFHDITDAELNEKIALLREKGFNAWRDQKHWCLVKAYK